MDLKFLLAFAPNNTQIAEVLIQAASNITAFNIDTGYIFVDGIRKLNYIYIKYILAC